MFLHFFCTFAPKLFEFFSKILLFMEYNFRDIEGWKTRLIASWKTLRKRNFTF